MDTLSKSVTFLSAWLASCFLLWIHHGTPCLLHSVLCYMTVAMNKIKRQDFMFPRQCCWRLTSPWMWWCIIWRVVPIISKDYDAFIFYVKEALFRLLAPEDKGTVILSNTENHLPNVTAPQPRIHLLHAMLIIIPILSLYHMQICQFLKLSFISTF
jgi:hypothetical protein